MMETLLIDVLSPVLAQWPVVAVLLVVGWYIWQAYRHCQDVLEDQLEWFQTHYDDQRIGPVNGASAMSEAAQARQRKRD
jgi:hypothetical protein